MSSSNPCDWSCRLLNLNGKCFSVAAEDQMATAKTRDRDRERADVVCGDADRYWLHKRKRNEDWPGGWVCLEIPGLIQLLSIMYKHV